MRTRVTVVSLSVCLSDCLFVLTLVLAYDVRATYQLGHCRTPKVFNLRISLKRFLSWVIHVAGSSFGIAKWSAVLRISFILHRCGCVLECSMQCACAYILPDRSRQELVWRASRFTHEEGSGVMPIHVHVCTWLVLAALYSAVQSDR